MITVTSNVAEFQATLRQAIAASSSSINKVIQRKAFEIIMGAFRRTKRTSRPDIENLGIVGYQLERTKSGKRFKTKKGQIKRSAIIGENTRAQSIIIAAMRKNGTLKGSSVADISDATRKLIMRRLSSIGFIASGWLAGIRALSRAIGRPARASDGYGKKPQGSVRIDAKSWNPSVTVANEVWALDKPSTQRFGQEALAAAIAAETESTLKHLAEGVSKEFTKRGAKATS